MEKIFWLKYDDCEPESHTGTHPSFSKYVKLTGGNDE